jgi:hypothetical protein
MANQQITPSFPLDPQGMTGPVRTMSGVLRTGAVTLDTPYNTPANEYARWLYVGVTGNITYVNWDGTTTTLTNIVPGVWHPILSTQVNTAGTTASGLVWGS